MENLLHYSKTGNNQKVRAIIEEHYLPFSISPDIFTDNYGRTACWLAILNSWTFYELPQYLVSNGASLEVKDVYGKTILHEVIRTKNLNAFKFLLKNNVRTCGAIVEASTCKTALMFACELGNAVFVKLITSCYLRKNKKALLEETDINGNTAMHYAAKSSLAVTKCLLRYFLGSINEPNNNNENALLIAAEGGKSDAVDIILSHHGNPSMARFSDSFNAMHLAVLHGHRKIVTLIAQSHPDLVLTKINGLKLVDYVKQNDLYHLISYLELMTYDVEKKLGILPPDEPTPSRRRKKSKNELNILRRHINAIYDYIGQRKKATIMRRNNLLKQYQRHCVSGKRVFLSIFFSWKRSTKLRRKFIRIFHSLKTSHERCRFSKPLNVQCQSISLYEPKLSILERLSMKKYFFGWKLYWEKLHKGKIIFRISTYSFLKVILRRLRLGVKIDRWQDALKFKVFSTWYIKASKQKYRNRIRYYFKILIHNLKVQIARNRHRDFLMLASPTFARLKLYKDISILRAKQFRSLKIYVHNLAIRRNQILRYASEMSIFKLKKMVMNVLVSIRKNSVEHRAALMIQKYIRSYLVQHVYHKDNIRLIKEKSEYKIRQMRVEKRVWKCISLLSNTKSKTAKEQYRNCIPQKKRNDVGDDLKNWTARAAHRYKLLVGSRELCGFTEISIRNIHLELRKFGIRTSRSIVLDSLGKFKLLCKGRTSLRLDMYLVWLLMCARIDEFDRYYIPLVQKRDEERQVIHRVPIQGTEKVVYKRLNNKSTMKFSIYKIMKAKLERKRRSRPVDKYAEYPKILVTLLRDIDAIPPQRKYDYTKYSYFKEEEKSRGEKTILRRFSTSQYARV